MMNQEINNQHIYKTLNDICEHKQFATSPTYKRLLHYLVEKSLAGEDLKEYTIGNDLYGIDYGTDKSNGTVRSYMYKLRKKLAAYYGEVDLQHAVVFEIEKGQYNLHFRTKKECSQHKKTIDLQIPVQTAKLIGLILFLVLISCGIICILNFQTPRLWKNFFKNGSNNLVVISDQYILMETNRFGEQHATMYPEINNDEDFYAYKQENPEREIRKTDFTVASKMAPYGVKTLDAWFIKHKQNFGLQLESDLTLKNIKENNIIFIGQMKTMNLSKSFFLKDSRNFTIFKDGFKWTRDGKEVNYNTKFETNGKVEYAMVSFTSLSPDKNAFYFVSNNDIGVMATLRIFTDEKWLKDFTDTLPNLSHGFNALFKVSGLQRTDMSCELIELEVLDE